MADVDRTLNAVLDGMEIEEHERQRRIARKPRRDGLQRIIANVLERKPDASWRDVLSELKLLSGQVAEGVKIETITDTEIEWSDKSTTDSTPISGLKDRVSRAKKQIVR